MARETSQSKTRLPTPPTRLVPSTIWTTEIEQPEARHRLLRSALVVLAAVVALSAIPGSAAPSLISRSWKVQLFYPLLPATVYQGMAPGRRARTQFLFW
jgi:hypothetical protein